MKGRILAADSVIQRLRMELSFLEQCRVLVCRYDDGLKHSDVMTYILANVGGVESNWGTSSTYSRCPRRDLREPLSILEVMSTRH